MTNEDLLKTLLEYMDGRFDLMSQEFHAEIDILRKSTNTRLLSLESSVDYLVGKVDDISVDLRATMILQEDHENRITKLELATS